MLAETFGRKLDRGDDPSAPSICVPLWRITRRAMKICKCNRAFGPRTSKQLWHPTPQALRTCPMDALRCMGSLVPRIACMRLSPLKGKQPLPGARLLQGVAVSYEVIAAGALQQITAGRRHVA